MANQGPKSRTILVVGGGISDIITNMEMKRLASRAGPTGGKIVRPTNDPIEPCLERYPHPRNVRVKSQFEFAHNWPDERSLPGEIRFNVHQ